MKIYFILALVLCGCATTNPPFDKYQYTLGKCVESCDGGEGQDECLKNCMELNGFK